MTNYHQFNAAVVDLKTWHLAMKSIQDFFQLIRWSKLTTY